MRRSGDSRTDRERDAGRPRSGGRARRLLCAALAALCVVGSPAAAFERIAVVAPLGDRHAVLGRQAVEGARVALGLPASGEAAAPAPEAGVPRPVELIEISDPCRGGENGPEDGASVAEALLEADVDAVVGLLCWSTLEPALREGTLDGIPMITSGVRAGELTDRRRAEGWDVWRVAPRVEDEGDAIARHILREWTGQPYAILDDGTIYGRELAERVSLRLAERGSEPILSEGFRPAVSRQFGLARRLESAGATHVFVAGERRDIAIIARDAEAAGLDLVLLGGDAMRAVDDDVPLPPGVEAVVLEPALGDGYREPTRAAVETLLQAEALAAERGFALEDALNTGEFDTAIGSVRFDRLGDLRRNLFRHATWDGTRFVPTRPVPEPRAGSGTAPTAPSGDAAPTASPAPADSQSAAGDASPSTEPAANAGDDPARARLEPAPLAVPAPAASPRD